MTEPYYRAIQLDRFADSFRAASSIVRLPWRQPGAGEIAVRNSWCGVNGIFDTQIARNAVDYVTVALPTLTGVEAIGVVTAIGEDVTDFSVGDAAVTTRFSGGYREANIGPAANFARMPGANRTWLTLASTGVSALLALEHAGGARPGQTVAVSAAAGGLGHLIVQLAKNRACRVVAICGGEKKAAFVRSLGADRVIDYRHENVAAVLAGEFPDGINVAIDTVGGSIFEALIDNLARHGRLVAAGAAQELQAGRQHIGAPPIVPRLYFKAASVQGFMNGLLPELWPDARRTLIALHDAGGLKVTFDDVNFDGLEQVHDAVERLLSGQSMGKVTVKIGEEEVLF